MNSSNTYDKNVTKQVLREAIGAHTRRTRRKKNIQLIELTSHLNISQFCQFCISAIPALHINVLLDVLANAFVGSNLANMQFFLMRLDVQNIDGSGKQYSFFP